MGLYIWALAVAGAPAHLGMSCTGLVVIAGHSQASQELSDTHSWPLGTSSGLLGDPYMAIYRNIAKVLATARFKSTTFIYI